MMQPISLNFTIFFSLLFLIINITKPRFLLANTTPNDLQHPDYEALLAIKSQISNDPYSTLRSWSNNSLHFCEWQGVTCGHRHKRRVVSLDLSYGNLAGTLSPYVGNLTFLHTLNLYNNSFRGHIPHQISHLRKLRMLALVRNYFEGEIPANLSRCIHLNELGLSFNNLVGRVPAELTSLPNLTVLELTQNNFIGRLQDIGIGNMSKSLQFLSLRENQFHGIIPDDIGRLKGLASLDFSNNLIGGTIPASLFNLSSLKSLSLNNINIQGHLPQDLGLRLPQLTHLSLANTSLSGQVPVSLSNLSKIESLVFPYNSFTGSFSLNGNNLPHLSWLNMGSAYSLGGETRDLSFLDTLTNCTNLGYLIIGGNSFTGNFPLAILNMSTTLQALDLVSNQLSGPIPFGLGKFVNLVALFLDNNYFTGPIPPDICYLESMQHLNFDNNNFSGELPYSLGNLTLLSTLTIANNNLEGSLPKSLGNCRYLQTLGLPNNKLSGGLPVELFSASALIGLVIGQNNFQGSLPVEISKLQNLDWLDVSKNRFSGEIPSTLGGCTSLVWLNMSQNSFVGSIPESLSPLQSIQELDLSSNSFSGQIPSYFSSWPLLLSLNLSFNNLGGEVPTNAIFANTSVVSIVGNDKLCGGVPQLHLPRCSPVRQLKKRRLSLALIVIISIACAMFVVLSISLCLYFLCSSRKRKNATLELQSAKPFLDVSYQMLSRATNAFSPSNLIGVGGFGSVYKGILHQDDTELVVAIKVMNLHNQGASKSFIVECNTLRNIRHRNLVRIITVCSSIDTQRSDFKALVYEFMPRGSLDGWLHSPSLVPSEHAGEDQSCGLTIFQRLSISIDVASALEYLHTGCASPIIHCDLKPTNILLDDEMIAHVGDFGLAKMFSGDSTSNTTDQTNSSQVRGTVGYAAPEYGLGSKVSLEGDMYSFGIIVLELMTSKKPTDPMFNDRLNLHEFAKSALSNQVMEVIDKKMLGDANVLPGRSGIEIKKIECIKSLIMIGVNCSLEIPQERMSIKDAVNELKSAKQNLLGRRRT